MEGDEGRADVDEDTFRRASQSTANQVSGSISASTPACHAGERGSTPRQRDSFLFLSGLSCFESNI